MSNPFGLVAISHATLGGVYYTANFTMTGAITWTKLTTTGLDNLLISWFRADPYDPLNRQYLVLTNGYVYTRNGGNWTKIMDKVDALALTTDTVNISDALGGIWADPTIAGRLYLDYRCDYAHYVLRSTNYGANWTLVYSDTGGGLSAVHEVQAYGTEIWISGWGEFIDKAYSSDSGATFTDTTPNNFFKTLDAIVADPNDPTIAYAAGDANKLTKLTGGAPIVLTDLQAGIADNLDYRAGDALWIDPDDSLHQRLGEDSKYVHYTDDGWATKSTITLTEETSPNILTALRNTTDHTAIVFGNDKPTESKVYALGSEADDSPDLRNGTNHATPPYTDAVPSVGTLAYYGIWVGFAPSASGVYVYADEQGDITDMPSYTGLGAPMFGDRASWRDMYADGYHDYHAQDVQADTPQIHAPWPAAAGEAPVSDGSKYVATDIATQAELNAHTGTPGAHHNPVTLDADAAVILDLSTQEIGLDVQNANTVFAGPTTGAANEPTFRAVVAADLGTGVPDGTKYLRDDLTWQVPFSTTVLHEHIINEDHSDQCDGSEDTFLTLLDFRSGSTAVYLNGVRQRLGTHYTEAAGLDSVVFVTPPEAGDELVIDYIVTYADYTATITYLLVDSDGAWLTDSDDEYLVDSDG